MAVNSAQRISLIMNSEEPGTRNQEPASALGLEALLSEVRSCPAMGCRHSVPGRKLREKGGQASGLCDLVRQMSELLVPRLRLMVNDRSHCVSRMEGLLFGRALPGTFFRFFSAPDTSSRVGKRGGEFRSKAESFSRTSGLNGGAGLGHEKTPDGRICFEPSGVIEF